MNQIITVAEMSNRDFLEQYARPGRIGLSGGATLIDRAIRRAERHVCDGRWSNWSHAFIFGERRSDGHIWVLESDLQAAHKHIRFGVQENRVGKYHNEELYGVLAILDFDLPEEKVGALLREGLDLIANATRYSIRELFGALFALRNQRLRGKSNVLAREKSFYCSALVQHLFCRIGIELCPGIHSKNSTPEDIFQTAAPHTTYLLNRNLGESKVKEAVERVRGKIRAKLRKAA